MNDKPKNLCLIPWLGFSNNPNGVAQPCCIYRGNIKDELGNDFYVQKTSVKDIFGSEYMKNLRQEFRENKKPAGCATCWKDESTGYRSKRMIYSVNGFFTDPTYDGYVNWEEEPEFPQEYQMIINNSCNLKCRSCSPSHSTQWQNENVKFEGESGFDMPFKQAGDKQGELWKTRHEWYPHLRHLEVVGGEPMYIKQWHHIFDELIELGYAKNIRLDMSTNCTIIIPELLLKLKQNFKRLGIGLSIDGTEKMYEYLRHPGKWDEVYSNMKFYNDFHRENVFPMIDRHHNDNTNIQITFTVGWLNALEMPKMHQLVKDEFPRFTKIWNNLIHWPDFMSLKSAPEDLKQLISHKWRTYDWGDYASEIKAIENFMFSEVTDPPKFKRNYDHFSLVDTRRNEKIWDVMPEEYKPFLEKFTQ
jgi:sulfatase maturation enzyme AslB (radical SAM superfamily)